MPKQAPKSRAGGLHRVTKNNNANCPATRHTLCGSFNRSDSDCGEAKQPLSITAQTARVLARLTACQTDSAGFQPAEAVPNAFLVFRMLRKPCSPLSPRPASSRPRQRCHRVSQIGSYRHGPLSSGAPVHSLPVRLLLKLTGSL